jgi:hypothetical protein
MQMLTDQAFSAKVADLAAYAPTDAQLFALGVGCPAHGNAEMDIELHFDGSTWANSGDVFCMECDANNA